jgi:hypothetical protein
VFVLSFTILLQISRSGCCSRYQMLLPLLPLLLPCKMFSSPPVTAMQPLACTSPAN